MKPEIVRSTELTPAQGAGLNEASNTELTPELAASLFEQRLAKAKELQPFISLKFFYSIKEKVVREQAAARKLLKIEETKQEVLDKYSFILNPSYFDQKIIS